MQDIDPNIDPKEKAKFDSMADDWWNPGGKFRTLHDINPVRLQFIEKQVSLSGKTILDIGCGGGILSEALAKKAAVVTGLDISESAITIASQHSRSSRLDIQYQIDTVENFAERHDQKFDVIICMELLEHVPDPESIINAAGRLLIPGGRLFLSTINRTLPAYLTAVVGAEYLLKLLPVGTHEYSRFIRPSELLTLCQKYNFEVTEICGITYMPLVNHFSLGKKPKVNYLMHARLS